VAALPTLLSLGTQPGIDIGHFAGAPTGAWADYLRALRARTDGWKDLLKAIATLLGTAVGGAITIGRDGSADAPWRLPLVQFPAPAGSNAELALLIWDEGTAPDPTQHEERLMTESVAIGSIRRYDSVVPNLEAGRCRTRTSLDIRDTTHGASLPGTAEGIGVIDVSAPRFSIDNSDIVSCHPPRSASGAFGDRLPHVALARRSVPWERRLADDAPWLALLLLRADEAELVSSRLRAGLGAAVIAAMEAEEPIDGDPTVLLLKVKDPAVSGGAPQPGRREAPGPCPPGQRSRHGVGCRRRRRLVRGRCGQQAALADATPMPYIACLVSLEGRDDVWQLPAGEAAPPLLVLNSFTFTSGRTGGTFENLMANLHLAAFGLQRLLRRPWSTRRVRSAWSARCASATGTAACGMIQ
jgi:hypothetical protein